MSCRLLICTDPLQPDDPIPPGLIHARWYLTVDEGPLALPQLQNVVLPADVAYNRCSNVLNWFNDCGAFDNGYPNIGKWISGFMVRYAMSYVDAQGNETDRGPWTPWFTDSTRALPVLFNVPLDASHRAVERKIYRQFYADVDNANPEGGVELVGQLAGNTTTQFTDQSAN
jgi:hypothetical protein